MLARFKKLFLWLSVLIAVIMGLHLSLSYYVYNHYLKNTELSFSEANLEADDEYPSKSEKVTKLDIKPMKEVDIFDEEAMSWTSPFGLLYHSGLVVFDANNDNLPDVYFCQDGQNYTRPTDEDAVLHEEPYYQHNGLYLHQGNDADGVPVYKQISELVKANDTYVKEELLVENYMFPREKASDDPNKKGRQATAVATADFNGDGRMDLLVGNGLPGSWWTAPETQQILQRYISPIGRESRRDKQPIAGLIVYFLEYVARDNTFDKRKSSRGEEFFGANSLFLNMGDKDNDGIPEWQDFSRKAGIEGQRSTYGFSIADVDLDGDLDIFAINSMDWDFWPSGSQAWAGAANQLYINQIVETGKLTFIEKSKEMNLDGVYDEDNPRDHHYKMRKLPILPDVYSMLFSKFIPFYFDQLTINGQTAESAQISWSALWQDVNEDGYPDLWVANDFSKLELYINQEGKFFKEIDHARSNVIGNWMGITAADYNGDLKEDIFIINSGAAAVQHSFVDPDPATLFEPTVMDSGFTSYVTKGYFDSRHVLISGNDITKAGQTKVHHSTVLPPDGYFPGNFRKVNLGVENPIEYDRHSIDPLEFAWGVVNFDMQNDGRPDIYFVGNMIGRAGGLFSFGTTGPGRLLINLFDSTNEFEFADLTVEHHLLNIEEIKYDRLETDNYVYRKSPLQNWNKRDEVYSYDRSVWSSLGRGLQENILNQNMIQASENAQTAISADLNNDGFVDLIIRNEGGYDSRKSNAKNLKYRKPNGETAVLPPPDHNYPVLTNYEPGRVRVFLNQYKENNWIKIKLNDEKLNKYNPNAIGAKVVVNKKYLTIMRSTQGSHVANTFSEINLGLGKEKLAHITVTWPDKKQTVSDFEVPNYANGTIIVSRHDNSIEWKPNKLRK